MTVKCGQQEGHSYGGHGSKHGEESKGAQSRLENNVLYVTGLEDATKDGVWSGDLEIKLE
jgi:hypothetical protein